MNIKVSIIVPVYNSEKYLHRCLDSIISQTYKNLEIILINDGSTDVSGEICDEYMNKDKRIKVLHQENKGVSASRNAGLETATGEYIQFVDSDDFLNAEMTEALITSIENDHSELAICSYKEISNSNLIVKRPLDLHGKKFKSDVLLELVIHRQFNSIWNKIYLRKFILRGKIHFDENLAQGEDLVFNAEYFKQVNIISLMDKYLYNYCRDNTDSLTQNYLNGFVNSYFTGIEALHEMLEDNNLFYEYKNKFYYKIALRIQDLLYNLFHKNNNMSAKQRFGEIRKVIANEEIIEAMKCSNNFNIQRKSILFLVKYKQVCLIYIYCFLFFKLHSLKKKIKSRKY